MDSFTRCIPKAIILKTSSENICPRSKPQVCAWSGVKSLTCCCYFALVVSDSVRPHRRQPTRLPRPWDSPRKNTGVGCHFLLQCMKVKSESEVAQLCPTPSNPMDCSLPGSSVHGIFQARVLEWGAIAFSKVLNLGVNKVKVKVAHRLQPARLLCPWNSPCKNTGAGSQPFPSPGDPPDPGIEPRSPSLQADSLLS